MVVQSEPDTDHLVAAIYRSAERGQEIEVWVTSYPTPQMLDRLKHIEEFENVSVVSRFISSSSLKFIDRILRLRYCRPVLVRRLSRRNFSLIVLEWGDGIQESRHSLLKTIRTFWIGQFSIQLQHAARHLGIPVVALPHGHSLKQSSIGSRHAQEVALQNDGFLPFQNRDSFAAYVVAHESDRRFLTDLTTMSGLNIKVWGSARFSPQWIARLYSRDSRRNSSKVNNSRTKVLFFLPKWNNSINRRETIGLLYKLASIPELKLWIREHPRQGSSSLEDDERSKLATNDSVVFFSRDVDSIRLIEQCDVLIEIESSIAIDAVFLGKRVIMPRYLQAPDVQSRFDSSKCVLRSNSCQETIDFVSQIGEPIKADEYFCKEIAAQLVDDELGFYDSNLKDIERSINRPDGGFSAFG